MRDTGSKKFLLKLVHVVERKQRRVYRGSDLIGDVAGKQAAQTFESFFSTSLNASDAGIVDERSLHVKTNPIERWQEFCKTFGHYSSSVQANAKA